MLRFGLLHALLEFCFEIVVGGLQSAALPKVGGGVDEVSESEVGLGLSVEGLDVFGAVFHGPVAVEQGLLELLEGEVAGCHVPVDDFLNGLISTLSGS